MSNATLLNLTCPWLIVLGGPCWLWALSFGCGLYLLVVGFTLWFVGSTLLFVGLVLLVVGFTFLIVGFVLLIMGYVYCHMLKFII